MFRVLTVNIYGVLFATNSIREVSVELGTCLVLNDPGNMMTVIKVRTEDHTHDSSIF